MVRFVLTDTKQNVLRDTKCVCIFTMCLIFYFILVGQRNRLCLKLCEIRVNNLKKLLWMNLIRKLLLFMLYSIIVNTVTQSIIFRKNPNHFTWFYNSNKTNSIHLTNRKWFFFVIFLIYLFTLHVSSLKISGRCIQNNDHSNKAFHYMKWWLFWDVWL